MHVLFLVSGLKDEKLIKGKPTWKLKHANSILESFEYFCHMSPKWMLIISSYTISKLEHVLKHTVYKNWSAQPAASKRTERFVTVTGGTSRHNSTAVQLHSQKHVQHIADHDSQSLVVAFISETAIMINTHHWHSLHLTTGDTRAFWGALTTWLIHSLTQL